LRVCFVSERAQGNDGWGRYTVEVVRALREQGVAPVLVTADHRTDPELAGIEVHPFLPRLFGKRGQTLRTLSSARRLRRLLKQCDAVHCFVELYAPLVALSCPRSVPFVQTAHGTWAITPLADPWQRLVFRPAFQRADTIVFQTKFIRDRMAERMRLPRHLMAPGGVRAELFETPAGISGLARTLVGRVVLSVGTVKERKGHEVTLEAVALARKALPDLHLVLIGATAASSKCARNLQQRAFAWGMTGAFHMLGHVPLDELVSWYQRADLFALLPVDRNNELEGLGLVYLESAAAGVPAIGVKQSGASEAIVEGETGLLVEQGNPQAASEAMVRLLTDDALRARMSDRARIRAHQLSWVNLACRLKDTYLALLSEKHQKSRRSER
jgi:glycosyltransferase involved in cell wall biosynthesis